jgi:small-conductance mechanosensitive channel/CRP-like cAMP-binding protein
MPTNNIWDQMYQIFWQPEIPYLIGAMVLITALLMYFRKETRGSYRDTLFLFLFGLAGQVLSAAMQILELPKPAAVVYEVSMIIATIAIIRQCGFLVFRFVLRELHIHPPQIMEDLVVFAAYVVFAIARIKYAGVNLSGILAFSALTTALLAFSMQDTLGNVLGGLVLQFDNSINVGDHIKVGEVVGRVVDIRWRSTAVETNNWETVIIPNAQLMKGSFTVLGRRSGQPLQWRRWIYFTVDPGATPGQVIGTVESAVRNVASPNIAKQPQPACLLLGFEGGNLRYGLRYWLTDISADGSTDSLVRINIFTTLQRAGIRVSEPQQTVHLVEQDEEHAEIVQEREIQRRIKALKGVDLFARLTARELRTLAKRLQYHPFAKGDVITLQGAISDCIYIIAVGEAEVLYQTESGEKQSLAKLEAGRFFGEMGLMTGEPRRATVVARTETICYQLDKSSFQDLIVKRPTIAENISKIIASRQFDLDTARQNLAVDAANADRGYRELLAKIRRFFNIGAGH